MKSFSVHLAPVLFFALFSGRVHSEVPGWPSLGGGFQESATYGVVHTEHVPWLWSPSAGWFYYNPSVGGGWLHDGPGRWRWEPEGAHPYVHVPGVGWFEEDRTSDPGFVWRYDLIDGQWKNPDGDFVYEEGALISPLPRDVYLRGTMNNWGNSGLGVKDMFVHAGHYAYRAVYNLGSGSVNWKVGDSGWTADTNFGGSGPVVFGTPFAMDVGGASSDIAMSIPQAGYYSFVLGVEDPSEPQMTVRADSRTFAVAVVPQLKGLPDGATADFNYVGGGHYYTDVELSGGSHALQIGDKASSSWGLSAAETVEHVHGQRTPLALAGAAGTLNVEIPFNGRFRFWIESSGQARNLRILTLERIDLGAFGEPLYLKGTINGASISVRLSRSQAYFDWAGTLNPGTHSFHFETLSGALSLGSEGGPLALDEQRLLVAGGADLSFSVGVEQSGPYRIRVDATNGPTNATVSVSQPDVLIVHYFRDQADYDGWGMHLFNVLGGNAIAASDETVWPRTRAFSFTDGFGVYEVIPVLDADDILGILVHKDGSSRDMEVNHRPVDGREIWLVEGFSGVLLSEEEAIAAARKVKVSGARWLSRRVLAWPGSGPVGASYKLYTDPDGQIEVIDGLIQTGPGGAVFNLPVLSDTAVRNAILQKYPYAASSTLLDTVAVPGIQELLKGHLVVAALDNQGKVISAQGIQTYGILDDFYTYTGALGVTWNAGVPTLRLWAPTAHSVRLARYGAPDASASLGLPEAMNKLNGNSTWTGVWTLTGSPEWKGQYYRLEVDVFVPGEQRVLTNVVTDPYSYALSSNSRFSLFVDLDDPELKPAGWDAMKKSGMVPEDIVIYELHTRDFSISDETVPVPHRGTFLAFTHQNSDGMNHLRALAGSGLSHLQLLPIYDLATVDEESPYLRQFWPDPVGYAPDGDEPQWIIVVNAGLDGYNWGYDPVHYFVPEGSYATAADGTARIRELREAVLGLHASGLRVIQDVVFNHTFETRQQIFSVLDKIVPGYYYRLDNRGIAYTMVCCPELMSENAMMQKLMVDALVTWARHYKIDAFRFDLMGDHTVANLQAAKAALAQLNLATHGVDGQNIYLFGEGWSFGSLLEFRASESANQNNLGGTGVGSFNDRIRDAVGHKTSGGFIDGVYTQIDRLRSGLGGNLSNVTFPGVGSGGTYTQDPSENVNYVTAHDNYTMWDEIILRNGNAASTVADRERFVRMQRLAFSLLAVGQGVTFYHAGVDILRSKSGDRNSYQSGDWFNRIDWTYQFNNFARGLPPSTDGDNVSNYPKWRAAFTNPNLQVTPAEIELTHAVFREMLSIRKSSPLFRLRTSAEIGQQVRFLNVGSGSTPGVIAYSITDDGSTDLDPAREWLLVLANGNSDPVTYSFGSFLTNGQTVTIHPLQADSVDPVIAAVPDNLSGGSVQIPGKSLIVLQSATLPNLPDEGSIEPYPVPVYLRGSFNNWGNSGLTAEDQFGYSGNNQYQITRFMSAGAIQFKVADANWGSVNFGASSGAMTLGAPKTLQSGGGNLTITFTASGLYRFSLNANNSAAPVLTIQKIN